MPPERQELMKRFTRIAALALLLATTLCLLPASAKSKPIEYEWLYSYNKKTEDTYAVQIGAWKLFDGARAACELLRSYGYEAFIYYDNNYRVCVGLFPDYETDPSEAEDLIADLKTLTRDSDYLTSCASAFAWKVKVPEEAKGKFSAFGGEKPAATAEPKRTKTELRAPYGKKKPEDAPTKYVSNKGKRIFMFYGTTDEYGICGFVGHKEAVKVLAEEGVFSYVQTSDKREGWVNTCLLTATKP